MNPNVVKSRVSFVVPVLAPALAVRAVAER